MTIVDLPEHFTDDARWLVQAIDPQARLCRLIAMDATAYRQASFLDDRMLATGGEVRLVRLDDVVDAGVALTDDRADWIFHIGHVGSTLVSRLLGELGSTHCLREPRSVRDLLAFGDADRRAVALPLRKLMGRGYADTGARIVKATSFASEYADALIGPTSRVLFLYASPRNYIASILAGPNSTVELRTLEPHRAARLKARGIDVGALSDDAQRAAAAWMCEMLSLGAAAEPLGDRARWFDFDQMLGDMHASLQQCAAHFRIEVASDQVAAVANGPLMRKYSKAMEYDYSPGLRRELLDEATADHGRSIDRAVAWLAKVASADPRVQAALNRSA